MVATPLDNEPAVRPSPGRRAPLSNCFLKVGPLPPDTRPSFDRDALLEGLKDYLLNLVKQTTRDNEAIVETFAECTLKNMELFAAKQRQYGTGNVGRMGEVGLVYREDEKIARLREAVRTGYVERDESVTHAWADIANIATLAQVVRLGVWPGIDPRDMIRVVVEDSRPE